MQPALLIRLRPLGPFRFGPASGARDQTDYIFHSDSLYAAVSIAMRQLGRLDEWLRGTATNGQPAVRLSSLFPFLGNRLFAIPPRTLWPPPGARLRAKSIRFLPLEAIRILVNGGTLGDDRWTVDPASECLLPIERNVALEPPFRQSLRRSVAVDRQVHSNIELHATACIEFTESAGLWCLALFADDGAKAQWTNSIAAAFRLLGDSGIGGERNSGWGRFSFTAEEPDFPDLTKGDGGQTSAWWTLSLFSPSGSDNVDWERGSYALIERNGRVDRTGSLKLASRMVEEGAVLVAPSMPGGSVRDVAPEGSEHPVYRAGLAVAVPIRYTPPRAPFLASSPTSETVAVPEAQPVVTEVKPVESAPEALPVFETPAPIEWLPPALPALESAPEPLKLPEPEPQSDPEPQSEAQPQSEPAAPADPWGWEPQDRVEEEPPRTDDTEPKGGQS